MTILRLCDYEYKIGRKFGKDHIEDLKKYGFSLIKSQVEPTKKKRLLEIIRSKEKEICGQIDPITRKPMKALLHLNVHNFGLDFREIIKNQKIERIATELLNDKYYNIEGVNLNYIINQYAARSSGDPLPWHTDDRNPPNDSPFPCYLQWVFSLEESSVKTGCSIVKPTTHLVKNQGRNDLYEVALEGSPGDCIVWDGRIIHGALGNTTEDTRWVLILTLTRWHIKQKFDFALDFPIDQFKALDNADMVLLGLTTRFKKNAKEPGGLSEKGQLCDARRFIAKRKAGK
jgi:hypothetical protein